MNLDKLFKTQAELDKRIVEEKRLQGKDLLDKKILALQVELGELANEWQLFKFWKDDPKPHSHYECKVCENEEELSVYDFLGELVDIPCFVCEEIPSDKNPLLEEYVDCLHFILSIGNRLRIHDVDIDSDYTEETATGTFNKLFETVGDLRHSLKNEEVETAEIVYGVLLEMFVGLGESHLGFTWGQIEQAYYEKNKTNHERQEQGY